MLELDDKDLRAIAGGRVEREKWAILVAVAGVVLACGGFAYIAYVAPPSWGLVWGLVGFMLAWIVGMAVAMWLRKWKILKRIRREYNEDSEG